MAQLVAPNLAPSRRGPISSSVAAMLATIVLLSVPAVATPALVPKFEALFRDFGVALPGLSRLFIEAGMFLSTPMGWACVGVYVLLAVLASSAASRRPALASALLLLALALAISYVVLFALGMFLPLTATLESMHPGRP